MCDPQRILILDEHETNRDIHEARLKAHGHEMLQAADARRRSLRCGEILRS
jgi:hypothetical protein